MVRKRIRELLEKLANVNQELGELFVFDEPGFDDSIVGISDDCRVIYDYESMLDEYSREFQKTRDEAITFIDEEIIPSQESMGDRAPIILHRLDMVLEACDA